MPEIQTVPGSAKSFRFLRLEGWQEGWKLYRLETRLVRKFSREEAFGLTSQMRRSARSVWANIAEGSGRSSDKDFAQFVEIAYGSVIAKASGLYRKLSPAGAPRSAFRTQRLSAP
jgi:hypothetical protein